MFIIIIIIINWDFVTGKAPFGVKSHFQPEDTFFFVIIASPNSPRNWGHTPASVLYSSAPRTMCMGVMTAML